MSSLGHFLITVLSEPSQDSSEKNRFYGGFHPHVPYRYIYSRYEYFIKFQPENSWSLDRGMNGVRYRKYIFTENMVFW